VFTKRVRFAFPSEDPALIVGLHDLLETGEFRPVIDRTYPLDQIVDAYRYVETGRKVGNVVVAIHHP
jgi:NADPH:quinone reductase-like Zn-dependent oxidoreductase